MKKLVVLLLVSLMAASAFATLDPDPDGIGVYFDTAATQNVLMYPAYTVGVPFDVWVCVTNPSQSEVAGLEFGYTCVPAASNPYGCYRAAAILPTGGINLGTDSAWQSGDYIVGLAAPLPAAESVPFIHWQFAIVTGDPTWTLEFFIGESSVPSLPQGGPAYAYGDNGLQALQQSTGGPNTPCATINEASPVANQETSFGSVKSLFK